MTRLATSHTLATFALVVRRDGTAHYRHKGTTLLNMNCQTLNRRIAALSALLLASCGVAPSATHGVQSPTSARVVDPKPLAFAEASLAEQEVRAPEHAPVVKPSRDRDAVFDRLRELAAQQIYQIYMRELNAAPGLRGKVIVVFAIAANGKVVEARTAISELHRPSLEEQILLTLRSIDFGPEDVSTLIVTYPMDFAPR